MTYTRRAAAIAILGSGTLLAAGTLGSSTTEVDRRVSVATADDADAYIGLVEGDAGVETAGTLFDADGSQSAPATVSIANRLTESVTVTLRSAADGLQFRRLGGGTTQCSTRPLTLPALDPGTAHTVAISPADPFESATDAVTFQARSETGETTATVRRSVSLDAAGIAEISAADYEIVLLRRVRPGSIGLVVIDDRSGARVRCRQVAVPGFRQTGGLLVRFERSSAIDQPSVSVAADNDQAPIPAKSADRGRSVGPPTVRTGAGVSVTVIERDTSSRSPSLTAAFDVLLTDSGATSDGSPPLVTIRVPTGSK
ncbi:hypothetical protein Halru_0545 [Halovivax ruber XH-70]|uniref:Uncharacterized protein n=1 Tax=Halovivax ruber (strain DSM 18193 / JCM 13892 / XH-70) TaxID=797302 RepID=L0I8P1_HALRX|nr:hypothetical protein [Halovivax ruber]AGB15178.1 hypothetical protein Halru_0545 [Halovivax ruber XH-70]